MQMFEDADEMPPPPKRAAVDPDQSASSSSDSEVSNSTSAMTNSIATNNVCTLKLEYMLILSETQQAYLQAHDDEVKLLPEVETFADVWNDGSASW